MNYKPNPLLYGASKEFFSAFTLTVTMCASVDHAALSHAVSKAMVRYPYFSICPRRNGNSILLEHNHLPVPVFQDDRCVVLGTEESNGHLLAFGCQGEHIFLHASHYIADGMGIVPLLKTVLFLYVSERYGTEGLCPEKIDLPDEAAAETEYCYPFPDQPLDVDAMWLPKKQ